MPTDTYEKVMYEKLLAHYACVIEFEDEVYTSAVFIASYNGGENVAIECTKCNEVIIDFDRPENTKQAN